MAEQVKVTSQDHRARELAEEAKRVKEEHHAREVRLNEEARRVNQEHANAGRAWKHAQYNATEVEKRVLAAEERGYERAASEAAAREAAMRDAAYQEAAKELRTVETTANTIQCTERRRACKWSDASAAGEGLQARHPRLYGQGAAQGFGRWIQTLGTRVQRSARDGLRGVRIRVA